MTDSDLLERIASILKAHVGEKPITKDDIPAVARSLSEFILAQIDAGLQSESEQIVFRSPYKGMSEEEFSKAWSL